MEDIISKCQLIEAYRNGQRSFVNIELDVEVDLGDTVLSGGIFKGCWLNVNFVRADLSNSHFLECSLKTADFRYANLTKAVITGCAVESTRFQQAVVDGFVFSHNSVYGQVAGQEEFGTFHIFT